jgi:hypothetical protein
MKYDSIDHHQIASFMQQAFAQVDPKSLAYLYATGKSELYARDLLSSFINNLPDFPNNYFVGREWKRHDMTINNGELPVLIVEGKSNTHYDAANKGRLLKNDTNMRKSVQDDVRKSKDTLRKAYGKKGAAPIVITNLLFGVDLDPKYDLKLYEIGYAAEFRKAIKKHGSFDQMVENARTGVKDMLSEFGEVAYAPIECGTYRGMRVVIDFFAMKVGH